MNAYDEDCLNELAGRIEGVGRVVFHLVAMLEDAGVINGKTLTNSLPRSVVPKDASDVLLTSAKRTLERAAIAIDEARQWRKFRRQASAPIKRVPGRRKAA